VVGGWLLGWCVFVLFPDLPQGDLFDGHRLAVPSLDMLAWRGGRLPLSVQQALYHETRRHGLR
jgi:hypothetical protein